MSKTLQVGQRVKCFDNFGTISDIKERYSPVADDMRTFVSICWDSDGVMDHVLSEFKRHGGPIEEVETKLFHLYLGKNGIKVAQKGEAPSDAINKIELNESELRGLIKSAKRALRIQDLTSEG